MRKALRKEEEKHMALPFTSNQQAWELFVQGAEHYRRFTKGDNAKARDFFQQAIGLDPQFARAYADLAATHRPDGSLAWSNDPQFSLDEAYRLAEKAVDLARREPDPKFSLPFTLEQMAYVLEYSKKLVEAQQAADEAVKLNPYYADGWAVGAHVLIYSGKPADALERTAKAIRLSSLSYPFFFDYHLGQANWVLGFQTEAQKAGAGRPHFVEAEKHLKEALRKNPNFRPARAYLVAVLVELGRLKEAKEHMAQLAASGRPQFKTDANRFNEYVQRVAAFANPAITEHLAKLWKQAE